MFCVNCGKELKPDFKFCGYCGTPVEIVSVPKSVPPIDLVRSKSPAAASDRPAADLSVQKMKSNGKRPTRKLKVLVIDDDPAFLESYLFKFEKEGFSVVLARNGKEGLGFALTEDPSVILLDILMPGMNGLEVLRRLKADPKTRHIPVVLATIVAEKATKEQGLALGADYYITKDVMNSDDVVDKVREAALRSNPG